MTGALSKGKPTGKFDEDYLRNLEQRIARIEAHLNIGEEAPDPEREKSPPVYNTPEEAAESLEFQIGQFWFAKVGIVILAIGIAFLLTFPYKGLPAIFPSLIGYLIVGLMLGIAHLWRKTFTYLSRYLIGGGLILLYFSTLRLHFFSAETIVRDGLLETSLLLLIVFVNIYVSLRRKSVYLSTVTITLGYITAVLAGNVYLLFILNLMLAVLLVWIQKKYIWQSLVVYGIFLTYLTHFIWFLNNPFLGNKIHFVDTPQINILFLFLYAIVFALGNLTRDTDLQEKNFIIANSFMNSLGFYLLLLLITVLKFKSNFTFYHSSASLVFLGISMLFWVKERSKYSTFFYAILGYSALSIAIIAQFKVPDCFVWLSWQSLLVIITALWFRSKIIVLANFIIFLLIFITFLFLEGKISAISLSFGVVALLSARIMNWKKHRLELKTELMRNSYLGAAFFIIPYALYHSVPAGYVALAWSAVAIFYYTLSVILTNRKYRWMALLTLMLTILYVFVIGIAKLEPVYRIVSFIALGSILLVISIIYTKLKTSKGDSATNPRMDNEK